MSDLEALQQAVAKIIPFNRVLNISIVSATSDNVEVVQPEAPERMNYVGAAHTSASVLFMLAEAATEAMVLYAFRSLTVDEDVVPFVIESTITYQRPARGTLRAISTLAEEEQARVRDELQHTGRARFPISTRVIEEGGMLVASLEARWGLRRLRRDV